MISWNQPETDAVRRFLESQSQLPFSYDEVGATTTTPPAGYVVDHTRIKLGNGKSIYDAARAALTAWQHFQLGWVIAEPANTPIQVGNAIAVYGRFAGIWFQNAARIVYVIDEQEPVTRFGFAYGTLPAHVEKGEERFQVEWHPSDETVWYDILAFSRPNHLLTKIGYPIVRQLQKRFASDSAKAMRAAVNRQ